AYAYLRAMGVDGKVGQFTINMSDSSVSTSDGHAAKLTAPGTIEITSNRYPMVAEGSLDDENTIRSGMMLVPFFEQLNQFTLTVNGLDADFADVQWGEQTQRFSSKDLAAGVNLPKAFPSNPFSKPFAKVDQAVAAKQAYETEQIKKVFHGAEGKRDIEAAAARTEAIRAPLAKAIKDAMAPVTHTITVTPSK
ncbi:MAG: lipolytic enzyme, partial [Rubripirellula sp.]